MRELTVDEVGTCWNPPCRVVLLTSMDDGGRPNIISVGWKMQASVSPPVFAVGLGTGSHSCKVIGRTEEFVLAVPGTDLAREVIFCGTRSGSDVDKFSECGLTAVPGKAVRAPLIEQCLANVECRVVATQDFTDTRVFFGEVVACWASDREVAPLLIIGTEGGYELVHEDAGYRLGAVRA